MHKIKQKKVVVNYQNSPKYFYKIIFKHKTPILKHFQYISLKQFEFKLQKKTGKTNTCFKEK